MDGSSGFIGKHPSFGKGDLVVFKEMDWHQMNYYDVLWRFFAAFIFAALALTTIAAMAMMFSVFSENSLGPIVATVCVVIVFTIIQQLKVPLFEQTINPGLLPHTCLGGKVFFMLKNRPKVLRLMAQLKIRVLW